MVYPPIASLINDKTGILVENSDKNIETVLFVYNILTKAKNW